MKIYGEKTAALKFLKLLKLQFLNLKFMPAPYCAAFR